MSFSVGVKASKDDSVDELADKFNEYYPEPADGVRDLFELGLDLVNKFGDHSDDQGQFSISISGHAAQSDEDRDSLSVSINPTS